MNRFIISGIVLVVIVVAGIVYALYPTQPGDGPDEARNYCTPEQRQAEACIEIYQPVCGWFDGEKIQCFAYPCAQTFSNFCFACMDENVLYWTEGECPEP
jgi:hypothetical protein